MDKKEKFRSAEWFGRDDKIGYIHRSWLRNQGHPDHLFRGRPVIGICNTWSDLTPCNAHLREFAEIVKRGVYAEVVMLRKGDDHLACIAVKGAVAPGG